MHSPDTLEVHEDFTGLYETENTASEALPVLVKDAMCRYSLDCHGQAYDGAANLSGRLSGVQARVNTEYPKTYTLFLSFVNLAICRNINVIRGTLDTVLELSNMIRYSPKRKALLERVRKDFNTSQTTLSNSLDSKTQVTRIT